MDGADRDGADSDFRDRLSMLGGGDVGRRCIVGGGLNGRDVLGTRLGGRLERLGGDTIVGGLTCGARGDLGLTSGKRLGRVGSPGVGATCGLRGDTTSGRGLLVRPRNGLPGLDMPPDWELPDR